HPRMLFLKIARLARLEVNHPDHLVLSDERHSQFRANPRDGGNVLSLVGDVVHQHGSTFLDCPAGYALADLHANAFGDPGQVPNLKTEAELLRAFVEQQDGKNLVINDPLYYLGHPLEQRIEVEGGVEHVSHFNQKRLNVNTW